MQQSNSYILVFTAILTLVLGGLLSLTSVTLKPLQQAQEAFDTKKKILKAVLPVQELNGLDKVSLERLYDERMTAFVVDSKGEVRETDNEGAQLFADRINIQKNHKIPPEERFFPVYTYRKALKHP